MKRFALIAMLLSLGFVAGCENKKPAVPATPPVEAPKDDAIAPKDDAAAPDKGADKEDMPDGEKDK